MPISTPPPFVEDDPYDFKLLFLVFFLPFLPFFPEVSDLFNPVSADLPILLISSISVLLLAPAAASPLEVVLAALLPSTMGLMEGSVFGLRHGRLPQPVFLAQMPIVTPPPMRIKGASTNTTIMNQISSYISVMSPEPSLSLLSSS